MQFMNQLPCPVLVTDMFGAMLAQNLPLRELVGAPPEDGTSPSMNTMFPPASRIFLQTHVWPTLLRDGRVTEIHLHLIDASGARVPVMVNAQPGTWDGQRALFWVLFVAQERHHFENALLQARRQAEGSATALAQSQRFIRNIADTIPGQVAYWDAQRRCQFANTHYLEALGLEADAVLGQPLHKVLSAEMLEQSLAHIDEVLQGEPQEFERTVSLPDGGRAYTLVYYVPDVVASQVIGFFVQISDITRLKEVEGALRTSQAFLQRTGALAGVGGWEMDLHTGRLAWSEGACHVHNQPTGFEPRREEWMAMYTPESRQRMEAALAGALQGGDAFDLELDMPQPDGLVRSVRAVGMVERAPDLPAVRLVGAFQDVTERRRMTRELEAQHELLRVTLQSIGDAVITTGADATVMWLNTVAERMTGWSADEARGLPLVEVFHIVDEATGERIESPVVACLARRETVNPSHKAVLRSRDAGEFGIEDTAAPIRNDQGEVLGAVLVFRDVTEQRRLSGEMTYRATHDVLTGLFNRGEFEVRLQALWSRARRDGSSHGLLFMDLDQFKLVNDSCGHVIGDHLLEQVSRLLADTVRARDTLARLGGDEFGILLEDCDPEQAERVAQKICDRMDQFRFVHAEKRFRIGVSIGLVPLDARWSSTAALQQAADTACYAAKEEGRNRVHVWFDTDAAVSARQFEVQWTSRIEHALDTDAFILFAQRIVAQRAGPEGLHAEVLLRMQADDGSLVLPGAFLPAAERFHLVSRIDRWVLEHVIRWVRAQPSIGDLHTLSVNLSGHSVGDRAFHAWAVEQLRDAGPVVCAKLCLEITETAAVTNLTDAVAFIKQVRAAGVRVALDDFGAGASSFGYLKTLPVDYLKIDGQFIRNLMTDALDHVAVRCFVDVAQVVGVRTVAEFVDRPDVLVRLQEMGVDYAQGYLLHRPEPLSTLLESWRDAATAHPPPAPALSAAGTSGTAAPALP